METEIAVVEPTDEPPRGSALATLREHALAVPVEQMLPALNEFADRRKVFRDWLLSHLVEGVHFGTPPGCDPKWCDARGQLCREQEAWGTLSGKTPVSLASWKPKKSLYAAGADFVCELMGVRDSCSHDNDGWVQAGSNAHTYVIKCTLYSRANGEILGDGLGSQNSGAEHLGANAAMKKAAKRAKVAAVLNWLGLRDLFTSDIEDGADRPLHENPVPVADAPKATPRSDRVTADEIKKLSARWKSVGDPAYRTADIWCKYVMTACCRKFNVLATAEWYRSDLMSVTAQMNLEGIPK